MQRADEMRDFGHRDMNVRDGQTVCCSQYPAEGSSDVYETLQT